MRSGFEWLRVVTPILVTINLFLMGQLYLQINELNQRVFQHMTNAELHITRSEFTAIQNQLEQMRREILETIRKEHTLTR